MSGFQIKGTFYVLIILLQTSFVLNASWVAPFEPPTDDALRITPESIDTIKLIMWAIKDLSIICTTFLLYFTASRLNQDNYYAAFLSFSGAIIAGCSPFLAESLFY